MKKFLITILSALIPNREIESQRFGTGSAKQYFTETTPQASDKVRPHELGHCLQQWACSLIVAVLCSLFAVHPLLGVVCTLVLGFPLWAVIYGIDILQGAVRTKVKNPKWKILKCLYVGYKKSFFEWFCRWFADQDQHDDWGIVYDHKYGGR